MALSGHVFEKTGVRSEQYGHSIDVTAGPPVHPRSWAPIRLRDAVSAGTIQVVDWQGERARLGPWQGEEDVAYMTPVPGSRTFSPGFVRRCLDQLAQDGYERVLTSALSPIEQIAFTEAGFSVVEPLCVLSRDLDRSPLPGPRGRSAGDRRWKIRSARAGDRPRILDVDRAAFGAFWRLDAHGLEDALAATPRTRLRLAEGQSASREGGSRPATRVGRLHPTTASEALGFSITGMSRRQGFLQRLAVDPAYQRNGVGYGLVVDAIRWLRRWRAERVFVNTHPDNTAALELYGTLGFRRQDSGIAVLSTELQA